MAGRDLADQRGAPHLDFRAFSQSREARGADKIAYVRDDA
jgi:hypothetical protein